MSRSTLFVTRVSMATAFILALVKFTIGIASGSVAVLSSAVDSLLDFGVSTFNSFAVKLSGEKPDRRFNYGKGKVESLAAFLEGAIITASGGYILYESVQKLMSRESVESVGVALGVMIFSVVVTIALVTYLKKMARLTRSEVLRADALHYQTDVLSNIGILVSLLLIRFTGWWWLDGLVGIAIALYIMHSAFEIVRSGFLTLLDASLGEPILRQIESILRSEKSLQSSHHLRTRRVGDRYIVQGHLVFADIHISLLSAHQIADQIERQIQKIDPEVEWEIEWHLDPYDDEHEEKKKKSQK